MCNSLFLKHIADLCLIQLLVIPCSEDKFLDAASNPQVARETRIWQEIYFMPLGWGFLGQAHSMYMEQIWQNRNRDLAKESPFFAPGGGGSARLWKRSRRQLLTAPTSTQDFDSTFFFEISTPPLSWLPLHSFTVSHSTTFNSSKWWAGGWQQHQKEDSPFPLEVLVRSRWGWSTLCSRREEEGMLSLKREEVIYVRRARRRVVSLAPELAFLTEVWGGGSTEA